MLTNTTPIGAYRGAGRPEAIYLIERLLDAAAREMKLDPAELRRRNLIRPEQMPYTNAMAQVYDCGEFEKILDQGLALADWNGFAARREASKRARQAARPRHRHLPRMDRRQRVRGARHASTCTPDGMIEIVSATQAMGQGIATSYAQLAVDVFDVPIERSASCRATPTAATASAAPARARCSPAARRCTWRRERTIDAARKSWPATRSKRRPADIEYRAGRFSVAGTDLGIDLFELAGKQPSERIFVDSTSAVGGPTWPNACHVCEVEIDPDTGDVEVVAYCVGQRHRPRRQPARSCAARSKAARCRASARRCASRWSTTPRAARC